MDNRNKLIAPKPVRMNLFSQKNISKISYNEKRNIYRRSDRIKSENLYNKHCSLKDHSFDLCELEKEFFEIEARSEIFSILNCHASFSSFAQRDTVISNTSFDEANEEIPYIFIRPSKSNSKNNIRS